MLSIISTPCFFHLTIHPGDHPITAVVQRDNSASLYSPTTTHCVDVPWLTAITGNATTEYPLHVFSYFQLCIFIQMTSSHPKGDRVIECRHQRNQVLFRALHLYYTISQRHDQNGTFSWLPTRPEKRTISNSVLKIPCNFLNLPCKFHIFKHFII